MNYDRKVKSRYPQEPRRAKFEVGDIIEVTWKDSKEIGILLITNINLFECNENGYVTDTKTGKKHGSFQMYTMRQIHREVGKIHNNIGISVVEDIWKAKLSKTWRVLFA